MAGTSLQTLTLLQKSSEESKLKKMWHETLDSMSFELILASVIWVDWFRWMRLVKRVREAYSVGRWVRSEEIF